MVDNSVEQTERVFDSAAQTHESTLQSRREQHRDRMNRSALDDRRPIKTYSHISESYRVQSVQKRKFTAFDPFASVQQ